jgi:hypothetical protein
MIFVGYPHHSCQYCEVLRKIIEGQPVRTSNFSKLSMCHPHRMKSFIY